MLRARKAIDYLIKVYNEFESKHIKKNLVEATMPIPKMLLKWVIGYWDMYLVEYKSKFNVEVIFDWGLILDDVFAISDLTTLKIWGKWNAVEYVVENIN